MLHRNPLNRLYGRVYGWFDSKEAGVRSMSMPAQFSTRARLALTNLEDRSVPASPIVSNLNDSGVGSLRQAFTDANADTLDDTVTFTVTGTINLNTSLPFITGNGAGTGNFSMTGPGSNLLTVRRSPTAANSFGNLLVLQDATDVMTASVSGVTFSGATTGDAVFTSAENVTFTDVHIKDNQILTVSPLRCAGGGVLTLVNCVISGNSTIGNGGAIYLGSTGSVLTMTDCTITGNTAVGVGGAIRVGTTGSVTATNTTISNNRASNSGGGIYFFNGGSLNLDSCTISGNASSEQTGGIYFYGPIGGGGLNIINTTITGNISRRSGAGIGFDTISAGTATIQNSTITNNTSRDFATGTGVAGGVSVINGGGPINIDSSIISGNFAPNQTPEHADLDEITAGSIFVTNSAIGVDPLFPLGAGNILGGNLDLAPLAINTPGRTATIALGAQSVALDKGVGGPAVDANGVARPDGGAPDIGAFERVQLNPDAQITSPLTAISVNTPGPNYLFTVEYDVNGIADKISAASIGNNDIRVTRVSGPAGFTPFNALATAGVLPVGDAKPLSQQYQFAVPGGSFDAADNGVYEFTVEPNSVLSTSGNKAPNVLIGRLTVGIAQTFTVTNLLDSGTGSLREAFNNVNVVPSNDTIVFDPALTSGGAVTIDLKTQLPIISDSVTINGPGAAKLTVRRENGSVINFGIFSFINNFTNTTVNVSGLTLNRGQVANDGAGIFAGDEIITLNDVVLTGNSGRLGGGLFSLNGNVTILNSTLSSNTSSGTGGAYFNGQSVLVIRNSTINNNSAISGTTRGGGGIMLFGNLPVGGVLIENTTISGNTSNVSGGGIEVFYSSGTININNSTITGNKAANATAGAGKFGGGIALELASGVVGGVTVNINSTIISGNTVSGAGAPANTADIASVGTGVTLNISKSAIGVDPSLTFGSPNGANIPFGSALGLGTLASNGGLTKTISITTASAAKNTGVVLGGGPANDQRGVGFPRNALGGVDIGAFEFQGDFPNAEPGTFANVTVDSPATNPYVFDVTFKSTPSTIVVGSLDDGDEILVTGPNGFSTLATFVSANPPGGGNSVIATYKFTAPGGTWNGLDNGAYTISVVAGQVMNSIGNSVPAGTVGTFQAQLPITRIVTNSNDSGTGSFRQSVIDTNANPGIDAITFDPAFFDGSSQKIITFALGETIINDSVTITGPGSAKVAFNGGGNNRLLNIGGTGILTVTISGITFTNGNTALGDGGAIAIADEKVTLDSVLVNNNTSANNGGGILINAAGVLTVNNSTIRDNQATGLDGGGIVAGGGARVVLFNSTVSGNTANDDGGGVYFLNGGSFLMDRSTLSGNLGKGVVDAKGGGGIYFFGAVTAGDFIVVNSTISGNSHLTNTGGGIAFIDFVTVPGTNETIIRNSTIVGNSSPNAGGGLSITEVLAGNSTGDITLTSSIVSGNLVTGGGTGSDIATVGVGFITGTFSAVGEDPTTGGYVGGGSNLAFQPFANLLLGPLAINAGGTTKSHAPLVGSPLINVGSNPVPAATTDQNGNPRLFGVGFDIGSVEFGSTSTPTVAANGLKVNQGLDLPFEAQRSRLVNVVVTFTNPIDLAQFQTAGAVFFTRTGVASNNLEPNGTKVDTSNGLIITPASGTSNTITLTFANIDNVGIDNASLSDGRWQLSIVPAGFTSPNGPGDILLRRLFGDFDNNGTVDGGDFGAFGGAFGTTPGVGISPFDFDNNGNVDAGDFGAFGGRFGFNLA